jgi:phenylpyruvate tautomerase PptA (4-oxalocrotonate tautomerase family)
MPAIEITISQGRSVEQKRELIKALTRDCKNYANTRGIGKNADL